MSLKTKLTLIALVSLLSYIASKIFVFLGVPASAYMVYLLFGYVLAFWQAVLPEDPVDLFSVEKD